MWGTVDTNRYPFIVMLDIAREQFGSHIGISEMSVSTGGSGWWSSSDSGYFDGFWTSGVTSIVDMMGTRVITDLSASDFDIYDVKDEYLEYGTSNSFVSTIDIGVDTN
jgi:hypothetical protein